MEKLLAQAAQNERILRRYQDFELELLAAEGFAGVLEVLLERASQYFKLDAVELWLLDGQKVLRSLAPPHTHGMSGLRWVEGVHELHELYSGRQAVQLQSRDEGEPLHQVFPGRRVRSVALVPLVRHGQLIGSLHFGAFSGQRFTADKSTDFIAHLGSIVALCLENAVNQERLHHLSLVDVLTRVHNRRAFDRAMELELSRSLRGKRPLALLFVGVDHFQHIKGDYGSLTGDRILIAVAQEIAGMLRKTDHVCRYGDEQFALLLPACELARALQVAERIRHRVAQLEVMSDSGIAVGATLSIGVTTWRGRGKVPPERTAEALVIAADQAVQAAQAAGHDQVHHISCVIDEAVSLKTR